MTNPTLTELLAEGQRQLAAQRAAAAERAAAESAAAAAEQQARRATVMAGIATIVPDALMPFVQIEVDNMAYQYGDLDVPDCTPIRFGFDSVRGQRYDPWRVACARGANWTGRDAILCDDLTIALAHAAEQGARMAQAQAERAAQEAREAEDAAYAQAAGHAGPTAVPQRTLAEQLESLVRQIVRDELAAE